MKFIHTADWHIGRKLQQVDLLDDQEFVLNNLIEEMKEHDLDFIIIAGDLYDRSVPSREATTLLQELLIKIKRVVGEIAADDDPAVAAAWWRSFRLNLRQSLAWWLPVLVLLALGTWEYLLLADGLAPGHQAGGQQSGAGRMSGALSGLVLAGGVLLAAVLA